jgi:hypothetical protein
MAENIGRQEILVRIDGMENDAIDPKADVGHFLLFGKDGLQHQAPPQKFIQVGLYYGALYLFCRVIENSQ